MNDLTLISPDATFSLMTQANDATEALEDILPLLAQATEEVSVVSPENESSELSYSFVLEITDEDIVLNGNEASCSIDDFNQNFTMTLNPQKQNDCIIPPGLLYFNSNLTQIVFERPPQIIDMKVYPYNKSESYNQSLNYSSSSTHTYKIPIPWQIYVAEFSESNTLETLQIYFSTSEISKIENIQGGLVLRNRHNKSLMRATLPNIYKDNKVCLDLTVESIGDNSLESKINTAYLAFWQTNFNYDLLDNLSYLGNNHQVQTITHDKYHNLMSYWQSCNFGEVLDFQKLFFPLYMDRTNASLLAKVVKNKIPLYSNSSFGDKINSFMSKLPVIV
jgi:hypothetical protein